MVLDRKSPPEVSEDFFISDYQVFPAKKIPFSNLELRLFIQGYKRYVQGYPGRVMVS